MQDLAGLLRTAFRKFNTAGDSGSGAHNVDKDEVYAFGDAVDTEVLSALNRAGQILATVTGTNTITATASIEANVAGQMFFLKPANTNSSTTVTLNVSGKGALPLHDANGSAIPVGGLLTTAMYPILNVGNTEFRIIGQLSVAAASESVAGLVEIADATETAAGTVNNKAVSPLNLAPLLTPPAAAAVGSYAILTLVTGANMNFGDTIAYTGVKYASCDGDNGVTPDPTSPTGTWMLLGHTVNNTGGHRTSLFRRVS